MEIEGNSRFPQGMIERKATARTTTTAAAKTAADFLQK
jgi:hypothetical protein